MPLYDYECEKCQAVTEAIAGIDKMTIVCPQCKARARRIISASGHYCSNEDAPWLKSVLEVVGNETPEARQFHKDPTRSNYKAWMKAEGLRPMENGETTRPRSSFDGARIDTELIRRHKARNRITIRR